MVELGICRVVVGAGGWNLVVVEHAEDEENEVTEAKKSSARVAERRIEHFVSL